MDDEVWIHSCGSGEWIIGAITGGRPLHVYRLTTADWLVSEVGRVTEGKGATIAPRGRAVGRNDDADAGLVGPRGGRDRSRGSWSARPAGDRNRTIGRGLTPPPVAGL